MERYIKINIKKRLYLFILSIISSQLIIYVLPFLFYKTPFYVKFGETIILLSDESIYISLSTIICGLALWITSILFYIKKINNKQLKINTKILINIFYIYAVVGFICSLVDNIYEINIFIKNYIKILSYLSIVSIFLGFKLVNKVKNNLIIKLFLIINITSSLLIPLMLGYLTSTLIFLIITPLFIIDINDKDKLPYFKIVAIVFIALIIIIGLFSLKNAYRINKFGSEFIKFNLISIKNKIEIPPINIEIPPIKYVYSECDNPYQLWYDIDYALSKTILIDNVNILPHERQFKLRNSFGENIDFDIDEYDKFFELIDSGVLWPTNLTANKIIRKKFEKDFNNLKYKKINNELKESILLALKNKNYSLALAYFYENGIIVNRDYSRSLRFYLITLNNLKLDNAVKNEIYKKIATQLVNGYGIEKNVLLALSCSKKSNDSNFIKKIEYSIKVNTIIVTTNDDNTEKPLSLSKTPINFTQSYVESINQFTNFDPNINNKREIFNYIDYNKSVSMFFNRLNQLGNLTYAQNYIDKGDESIGVEIYDNLYTSIIPRFIWKNKPVENSGYLIGRKLKLPTHNAAGNIAWSMPVFVESFLAGGFIFFIFSLINLIVISFFVIYISCISGGIGIISILIIGNLTLLQVNSSGLSATFGGTLQAIVFIFIFNIIIYFSIYFATSLNLFKTFKKLKYKFFHITRYKFFV